MTYFYQSQSEIFWCKTSTAIKVRIFSHFTQTSNDIETAYNIQPIGDYSIEQDVLVATEPRALAC